MLHLLHHVQLFFFGVLFCKCFSFSVDTSKKQQSVRVWEVGSVRSALKHLVLLLNKEGGNSRLLKFPTVVSERGSEGKRRQLFLAGGGLDRKRIRKVRGPELEHWNPLTSMVPPSVTSEDGCWTAGHLWCFSVVVLSEKKQEELPLFKHMSTVFMGQSKTGFLWGYVSCKPLHIFLLLIIPDVSIPKHYGGGLWERDGSQQPFCLGLMFHNSFVMSFMSSIIQENQVYQGAAVWLHTKIHE